VLFENADNKKQHNGTRKGHEERSDESHGIQAHRAEKDAADVSAEDADKHIPEETVAPAAHNPSCKPTGEDPDDKKRQKAVLHVLRLHSLRQEDYTL
jgi:hypothetical protein